ncbi:shikimate kinase [Oculatella sp. LEGE 06141]|nr:shikimate kinase [Oculatella sp. LEGE 06141]
MMGAGKSTVGRILASQLNYRFFDTDTLIEQVTRQSIAQLFAESGEAAFRELETQVLADLSSRPRLAIATGGGIVLQRKNWSYLHHGIVVWLDVPIDVLYRRIQHSTTRPLLNDPDPFAKLQTLFEQRRSLYAQADVRVSVSETDEAEQVAARVLTELDQVIKPQHPPMSPANGESG